MMSFQKLNQLIGWGVFGIAFLTYWLTMEQTASFWDCGEFIAVSYKLMVSHPPGAPLFMLVARLFSFLSLGNGEMVAYWINMVSVLSSALTILFLFWTITLLARKIIYVADTKSYNLHDALAVVGSGVVGAFAYTFSDTFWFSAVEAEVYAMSSFFTALVVWAILQWEKSDKLASENRWLLFIAYMVGLSIGVHLLNLLAIPVLALVFYYKKYKNITLKGVVIALVSGVLLVVLITYGIIPGLPSIAAYFELIFVNSLGLPFYSGAVFFILAFLGAIIFGIYYSIKKRNIVLNISLLSLVFVLIGYSSYTLIIIRANYNPPINENNPDDLIRFVSYLKREQYGSRPLAYGNHYNAKRTGLEKTSPIYRKGKTRYEIYDYKFKRKYAEKDNMLFPRIYSTHENHKALYAKKLGLKPHQQPTFVDNIRFFLSHQLGHMYLRYFMWNFAGRESDSQDADWLLPWHPTPPETILKTKSFDNFYMLPLILGLIGLFFQYLKHRQSWSLVMLLFLMLGVAIVLYINSPPVEPRERDYVYAGSFYAFCIWIGLGVLGLWTFFKRFLQKKSATWLAIVFAASVPVLMASKSWDNHNRQGRYLSIDQARNTLAGCAKNAILFTGGDNDTFPLWYVQEVEGFRTDVRVVVLSYFNTDWYIDQMKRPVYASAALPISFEKKSYIQGKNNYLPVIPSKSSNNGVYLRKLLSLIKQEDKRIMIPLQDGTQTPVIPSKKLIMQIDSASVIAEGLIPKGKEYQVVSELEIVIKGSHITKNELMILDIIANADWKRPIYFNTTSANTMNLDMRNYLQMEGMVYRLLPIKSLISNELGEVDLAAFMNNLPKFRFRGLDDSTTYNSEDYRNFASNFRNMYWRAAFQFIRERKPAQALDLLNESLRRIPDKTIAYSNFMPNYVELYQLLEKDEQALEIAETLTRRAAENLDYILDNNLNDFKHHTLRGRSFLILQDVVDVYRRSDQRAERRIRQLESELSVQKNSDKTAELRKLKKRQIDFQLYLDNYSELLDTRLKEFYKRK